MRRVHRCTEPKAFLTRAESFLRAAEVENALMLGICGSARCDDSCYLATVEEDQVVVAGGHRSGPAHRGPVEPYWRRSPPTEDVAKGCLATSISDFLTLPGLLASFSRLGYDVAEMVLADEDGWDRYEAAKWLTMRRWLEANPDDELAEVVRADLTSEPERYAAYTREYLGWGVFALMPR